MSKTPIIIAGAAVGALAIAAAALAQEKNSKHSAHWGYGADNGPSKWASMHPKFKLCGAGKQQSPINVPTSASAKKAMLKFAYNAGGGTIVNNGHTLQVNVPPGSYLHVGGKRYQLLQFHFHTPSENHLGGRSFPMEMHMVHKSDDGKLAVVAVMIRRGSGGTAIERLPLPAKAGDKRALGTMIVDPKRLLPANRAHFAFGGSLTTPPCSEGVAWFVMANPIRVSAGTLKRVHAILGSNNRPLNPLNGRMVHLVR